MQRWSPPDALRSDSLEFGPSTSPKRRFLTRHEIAESGQRVVRTHRRKAVIRGLSAPEAPSARRPAADGRPRDFGRTLRAAAMRPIAVTDSTNVACASHRRRPRLAAGWLSTTRCCRLDFSKPARPGGRGTPRCGSRKRTFVVSYPRLYAIGRRDGLTKVLCPSRSRRCSGAVQPTPKDR